jgi:RHS repeat-associated protein
MKDHKDKGILQIDYNFLNLPKNVTFNDYISTRGGKIYVNTSYIYRADGVKVGKQHKYKNPVSVSNLISKYTDYLDGFQYEEDLSITSRQLKFVPTSEGYFDFEKNKYIYNYADHLGNIRLSYFHNGSSIEVLEENNYYPFGLKHEGYNALAGNPVYQYKYQGQELQETGFYSFKWRNYMPDVGRFFNVDPLAEKYPTWAPYVFSGNRIIDARELEGLEPYVLFNTRENAAANFGQQYNGKSILNKKEYAALIYSLYKDGKKYYAYNQPEVGGAHGVPQGVSGKAPRGSKPVAWIHTHGNDDYGSAGNYDDQNFSGSGGDKGYSQALKLDGFLVTPDGSLKYYDLSSNTDKTLRTDMPSDPNNQTPRKNKINPTLNPNPSSGDYRPKPKPFPDLEPIPNDQPKSILDGGIKSIDDRKREQEPLINRMGPKYHQ